MAVLRSPKQLQPKTKKWWLNIVKTYDLKEPRLRVLTLAAEALDRSAQARDMLNKKGLTYLDRFGQPRQRPEFAIEKESKLLCARLIRELELPAEDLPGWLKNAKFN